MNGNEDITENNQDEEVKISETNSTNQIESDGENSLSDSIIQNEKNTEETSTVWTEVTSSENNVSIENTTKSETENIGIREEKPSADFQNINNSYSDNFSTESFSEEPKKKFNVSKLFKNKWFYIILALLIALGILTYVVFGIILKDTPSNENNSSQNNTENNSNIDNNLSEDLSTKRKRKIDGVLVEETESNIWPFAVIIENSLDARPLSGVNEANICYEALVEGSITRFICIYSTTDEIKEIGPVRSARPYYGDIADEYNALFVHFGGSSEALERIQKGYYNIVDMNGVVYDGIYFWRDNKRNAPHNAYISSELIERYLQKIGELNNVGNYPEWSFTNNKISEFASNLVSANSVDIEYSDVTSSYNVIWKYNSESDLYSRYYENGKADKDSSNNIITAQNIIIQFTDTKVIDDQLRKSINLTEGGKAIMIRNGYSIEGYWRKNSLTNRTKFYTIINGVEKEFEFNPGKTWVNIVPKDSKININ